MQDIKHNFFNKSINKLYDYIHAKMYIFNKNNLWMFIMKTSTIVVDISLLRVFTYLITIFFSNVLHSIPLVLMKIIIHNGLNPWNSEVFL